MSDPLYVQWASTRALSGSAAEVVLNGTAESLLVPGQAGLFVDLLGVSVNNPGSAAVQMQIRAEAGGPVLRTLTAPAGETREFVCAAPMRQGTAGAAWTVQAAAAASGVAVVGYYRAAAQ